jgi:predicted phage terminase large subunit-like protein
MSTQATSPWNIVVPPNVSPAVWLASQPELRNAWLEALSDEDKAILTYTWSFWARPNQLPPAGDYRTWLLLAGRGWGKTRTGAETVRGWIESGECKRLAIVNDTAADVLGVNIHGPDGLIAVCPPWDKPKWNGATRSLTWKNGAVAITYSAEAPELLRGPQHDGAWADEPAKWKNLRKKDAEGGTAWDNLMLGLRMGNHPRCVATTTPRPIPLIKDLLKRPNVVVTRGNTFENDANLTDEWFQEIESLYGGTRLGRQELYAELLEDIEGALWNRSQIDALRVQDKPEQLKRIVVAIDPAVSTNEGSAETGIVVAGLGVDGHGYVLADVSGKMSPDGWVQAVVKAYHAHAADRVVAEINNGGNLVGYALRTVGKHIPYKELHASRGKRTRAEPVAALYEQGKVHHVGTFSDLEDQLTTWDASANEASPDRLDALVWALTELMLESRDVVAAVMPKNPVRR